MRRPEAARDTIIQGFPKAAAEPAKRYLHSLEFVHLYELTALNRLHVNSPLLQQYLKSRFAVGQLGRLTRPICHDPRFPANRCVRRLHPDNQALNEAGDVQTNLRLSMCGFVGNPASFL